MKCATLYEMWNVPPRPTISAFVAKSLQLPFCCTTAAHKPTGFPHNRSAHLFMLTKKVFFTCPNQRIIAMFFGCQCRDVRWTPSPSPGRQENGLHIDFHLIPSESWCALFLDRGGGHNRTEWCSHVHVWGISNDEPIICSTTKEAQHGHALEKVKKVSFCVSPPGVKDAKMSRKLIRSTGSN